MAYQHLKLTVDNAVATITLDRPDAANAVNLQLAKDLAYAAMECDENPAVRAIIVTATGRFFCSGGDIASFAEAGDQVPLLIKEITTYLHAAISRFARCAAPVITSVNGAAAGAGFSLACAGDLVVAADAARFTMAYTRIGLTPDGSATYYLPRLVGPQRALELMLTNRSLTAQEAQQWGLVSRVFDDADLPGETMKLALSLAAGPTLAFGRTKELVRANRDLETQMELETRAISDSARTADGAAGIRAFLTKEKPTFTGR